MNTNGQELEKRLKQFGQRVREGWKAGHRVTAKQKAVFSDEIKKQWEQEQAQKQRGGQAADSHKASATGGASSDVKSSKHSEGQNHSH